eukprot:scaffold73758_cov52-Phaeocystis_antarctica.AAC.3
MKLSSHSGLRLFGTILVRPFCPSLSGQSRCNRRLRRRLARAPEAVAGRPVGRSLPWERRAGQSCQARPEEAQEPSWGTAKGAL